MEEENMIHSDSPEQPVREPYLGSVRFFKHMILAILALMILIPTTLSVVFGVQKGALRKQVLSLQDRLLTEQAEAARMAEEYEKALAAKEEEPPEDDPVQPEQPPNNTLSVDTTQTPEYQSLYPEMYVDAVSRNPISQDKTVYLTFDDGPTERTAEILDILKEYDVKATFFVIGRSDERSIALMKRIVDEGHTLGIHSYSHDYSTIYASVENYLADFNRLYTLIEEQVSVKPEIFRFPGGSINGYDSGIWRDLVVEMVRRGFVYFDWNVSSEDAVSVRPLPADTIVNNCLGNLSRLNRAVILMHDSAAKTTTVAALPRVIEGFRNAGFDFAPLSADIKPIIYSYPQ